MGTNPNHRQYPQGSPERAQQDATEGREAMPDLSTLLADLPRLQKLIEEPVDPYGGDWRGVEIQVADFCESGSSGPIGIEMDRDTGRFLLSLIAAAGTAASEVRELGYDPVTATRGQAHVLAALETQIGKAWVQRILARAAGKESDDG